MKDICIALVEDLKAHRLEVLAMDNRIAELNKSKALLVAKFQSQINGNKDYKNADQRKAALATVTSIDDEYLQIEKELAELGNRKALELIDQQYCSELLRVNLAFAGHSV